METKVVVCTVYLAAQAVFLSLYVPVAKLPCGDRRHDHGGDLRPVGPSRGVVERLRVERRRARRARRSRCTSNGLVFDVHPRSLTCRRRPSHLFRALLQRTPCAPARPSDGRSSLPPASARAARAVRRADRGHRVDGQTPPPRGPQRRARARGGLRPRCGGGQRLRLEETSTAPSRCTCQPVRADALYVFTPDVMQRMLDLAADCQAELVDGGLYLPPAGRGGSAGAGIYRVLTVVSVLGTRVRSQTQRLQRDRSLRVARGSRAAEIACSAVCGVHRGHLRTGVLSFCGCCRLLGLV